MHTSVRKKQPSIVTLQKNLAEVRGQMSRFQTFSFMCIECNLRIAQQIYK